MQDLCRQMKRRSPTAAALVIFLLIVGGIITIAQSKEAAYKLNAEASANYLELERAKQDLIRQFQDLQARQQAILIGAGIPAAERVKQPTVKDGIVEFAVPSPSPQQSPRPQ